MYRAAFLEEGLAVDAVGPAHQCPRPIGEVRHHDGADPRVVVDDLGLREPGLGVEDLVEVRQPQPPALDLNLTHLAPSQARALRRRSAKPPPPRLLALGLM